MARSTHDTLIYATILLVLLATAIGHIALTPAAEPVLVTMPATGESCPAQLTPPDPPTPPEPPPAPLESPTPPAPAIAPPTAGAAMLLTDRQLVLSTAADKAWARGRLRAHEFTGGLAVRRSVDPTRLPAALQPLIDARVVVYAADGGSCIGQVGALSIYGREEGESYLFEGDADNPTSPADRLAMRDRVYENTSLMIGRLQAPTRCDGLWARRADLPAPAVFGAAALDEAAQARLRAQVLAMIETEPAVIALRREYDAFLAASGPEAEDPAWPEFLRSTLTLTLWHEVGGPRRLLNVEIGAGEQGCGDYFTTRIGVLFTLDDAELVAHEDPGFTYPAAVMDLERDGQFEAVRSGGQELETRTPDGVSQSFSFPWHGCSC